MIGRALGHYRVESKLGEGGMGVVYKAHDPRLNRTVAIKVLRPDRVTDPAVKQRFVQEARAASALNHPAIVTIHDIRSDAGIDFIVMEYVEGTTLDQMIPATGLRPAHIDLDSSSLPRSRRSDRAPVVRRWGWAALLPIGLAGGYIGWQAWRQAAPVEDLRAEALTTLPGRELYPSLSPDGSNVVFTWTGSQQNNTDTYRQQIGAGSPLRLTNDPRNDYNPVWSPDGRWIAFLRGDPSTPLARSDRELRLIPPLGGPERKLADVRVQEITDDPAYLTWCPNSACVIVTDSGGEGKPDALFVIGVETGDKRQLTAPPSTVLADTDPSVSPDGKSLSFLRRTTWASGALHVLPLRNDMTLAGEARHVPLPRLHPNNAAWLSNGEEILISTATAVGGGGLWRVSATGNGPPKRLPFVGEDAMMPAFSRAQPDRPARLVYVRSAIDENIWRVDTSGPGAAAVAPAAVAIASTKADMHPQISPEGRRVAFTSTRSGAWEIWTSELDGADAVQISSLKAPTGTGAPHWSPDGRQIVFASDAEGQFDIFSVASGGGKPRNITSHPAMEHVPTFSSDGKSIYFSSNRSGQHQVWKVAVAGGEPVQVTRDGGFASQESADGAYLYFAATPAIGAVVALWGAPTAGGPAVTILEGMLNGAFRVIDRGIYFIDQSTTKATLRFFDFATRRSVTIAHDLGTLAEVGGFAASRDGRTVLFVRRDSSVDDLMLVEQLK